MPGNTVSAPLEKLALRWRFAFARNDDRTACVIAAIEPKLLAAEGLRAETRPAKDFDAWDFAHLALGILALAGRLTEDAVRHFNAALELNPNFATAAGFVGFALALDGRSEEAPRQFERALSISPRDPFNSFLLAELQLLTI